MRVTRTPKGKVKPKRRMMRINRKSVQKFQKGDKMEQKRQRQASRRYGNGSRSMLKRQRKSARELEKQASKTYDIRALWQRNLDLGMISSANSQGGLGQVPKSQPNNSESSPFSLSKIPWGSTPLLSKQQSQKKK